jgi:hypothetical protein
VSSLREALIQAGVWCVSSPAGGVSSLDYLLVGLSGAVVVYAAWKAIRHTLRPGEADRHHIKWRILDEEEGA